MENNYDTIGDIKVADVIKDMNNIALLLELNQTSVINMTYGDIIDLKNSAEQLINALTKDMNKMSPDLLDKLNSKNSKNL